ncbi:MAG TPA: putative PEP-binding protein [Acetobacteraceae bacterium]|nr:putative PEP-binding protein [Acetobacteraceae bacterium]
MAERRLFGRAAARGLARGVVTALATTDTVPDRIPGSPEAERDALVLAVAQAGAELEALQSGSSGAASEMLGFQIALLSDEELTSPALAAIECGRPAPLAWTEAMAAEIAGYAEAEDDYFAARTADLEDIRDRVLALLTPGTGQVAVPGGAVVAAADLPLSRFLAIDWREGGAIVLTGGSPASHVAMLARARGVPMVVGVGGSAAALAGCEVLVDAEAGEVVLEPGEASRAAFAARIGAQAAVVGAHAAFRTRPAATADGVAVSVSLNIADVAELERLDPAICDGIGLVRTELLFHGTGALSDEAAQYGAYRRIAEWADGRPVVIRTLDAGGDKPIPGVTITGESNPFLGVRGIRLSLHHPKLFLVQLRALARAAVHGDVRVMLPMVTVPDELAWARQMLNAALDELAEAGIPARRPRLGMMIEVPAAAIAIEEFDADFFSIGSNDLTQYVTAAARDIGAVAELADPGNPAVLRLIASIARHGREAGVDVSLCGDAAADPAMTDRLLRAGLRSLSVAPSAIGPVKQAIAAVDLHGCAA